MKTPSLRTSALSLVVCLLSTVAHAMTEGSGQLSGTVTDETGESLIEAQVTVMGAERRALTDVDGRYEVELAPGVYTVRYWAELKEARRLERITIEAGKVTTQDVRLAAHSEAEIAVQEVVVTARPDNTRAEVQVVRRQKSAAVSDGISAEQIARTPDSNASESVKRIVAATVQDSRYVMVRGLGGRYGTALLNGAVLPSPDPDASAVPLDLFPAALLANLTVQKTFTPEMPGSFAGGALFIETREMPSQRLLKVRLGVAGDTSTTGASAFGYQGGSLDYLGFDDGGRGLPASIPRDGPLTERDGLSQSDVHAMARSFRNVWDTRSVTALPSQSLTVTTGDTVTLGDDRLGALASLNVGHKQQRRVTTLRRTNERADEVVETRRLVTHTQSGGLGGVLSIGYEPTSSQQLRAVLLTTHVGDDSTDLASYVPEGHASSTTVERSSLRFVERGMTFGQLAGDHRLGGVELRWQANAARTTSDQPDTRETTTLASLGGVPTLATSGAGSADRTFARLADDSGGASFEAGFAPLERLKLRAGGAAQWTSRVFGLRRFRYSVTDTSLLAASPEVVFSEENLGSRVQLEEMTRFTDGFRARRQIAAGFAMGELQALESLRIVAGARLEAATQAVRIGSRFSGMASASEVERHDVHVLPSLSASLAIAAATQLRASYSMTVARPSFRELAPVIYFDNVRGRSMSGDPDLVTSRIHNADLRLERLVGADDVLSASVFAKRFQDPIEAAFKDQNGDAVTFVNSPEATLTGIELEARVALSRLTPVLRDTHLGANVSLMRSRIDLDGGETLIQGTRRVRPLAGQAPYVVNVELGHRVARSATELTMLYNVVGARIAEAGVGGSPDSMDQPVHRLDASLTQPLSLGLKFKVAGTNLLNQAVRTTRGEVTVARYRLGVAVLAALEWSLD